MTHLSEELIFYLITNHFLTEDHCKNRPLKQNYMVQQLYFLALISLAELDLMKGMEQSIFFQNSKLSEAYDFS